MSFILEEVLTQADAFWEKSDLEKMYILPGMSTSSTVAGGKAAA